MPWSEWGQFDDWGAWDSASAELTPPPSSDAGYGSGDDTYGSADSPYGGD